MVASDLLDLLGGYVNFLIHVSVLAVAAGEGSDIARKKLSRFSTVSMTQLVRTITLLAHHTVPRVSRPRTPCANGTHCDCSD